MGRFLSLLIVGILFVTVYLNRGLFIANQGRDQVLSEEEKLAQSLEERATAQAHFRKNQIDAETKAIARLFGDLATQKGLLDSAQQEFDETRNRGGSESDPDSLQVRIREEKETIAEIDRQLSAIRLQEMQLGAQMKAFQANDKLNQQQTSDQLDSEIQAQQLQLSDTDARLQQLRSSQSVDYTIKAQIKQLQAQEKDMKVALQQLKAQKQLSNRNWSVSRGVTQSDFENHRVSLKQTETLLVARRQDENAALADLNRQWNQTKQSVGAEKSNFKRMEDRLRTLRSKVDQIKAELVEHQGRLGNLRAMPSPGASSDASPAPEESPGSS